MPMKTPKKELLVPAGNFESFLAGLHNGADAIYFSLKQFGARAYAENFTNEEAEEALKLGHLYGVKVYVTMNTLVKEKEVATFLSQVDFLYKRGVDAILMQDFGMMCLCREMFPELEIHASTQVNNSTIATIRLLEKIGITRVVFPREMSLDEMEGIDTSLEKEVFIHGALCISYSGNCLFSFLNGGRSANRGECAGCCRLPYSLFVNGKIKKEGYLLSMKDLYTAPSIEKLLQSDIKSFKIEGRMKSPSYVAAITRYYRMLLDGIVPTTDDVDTLKILFHRGFTEGHLFQKQNLINPKSPNHIGLSIGTIEKITKEHIYIRLTYPLYQEDGIRFEKAKVGMIVNYLWDDAGKLVSKVEKGKIAMLRNTLGIHEKDTVLKTSSKKVQKDLLCFKQRKIPITVTVEAKVGFPLQILLEDEDYNKVTVTGRMIEQAKNCPTSLEKIKALVTRLQDTPFEEKKVNLNVDKQIFIQVGELNALRRKAVSNLIQTRIAVGEKPTKTNMVFHKQEIPHNRKKIYTFVVNQEDHLIKMLAKKDTKIYIQDRNLYQKYKENEQVYYLLPRNELQRFENSNRILTHELREGNGSTIGGYSLNVSNSYSAYYLSQYGYQSVFLSVELSKEEIEALLYNVKKQFGYVPLEMLIEGRIEAMVIKGNPFHLKHRDKAFLKSKDGKKYAIKRSQNYTSILGNKAINRRSEVDDLFQKGVTSFCQIMEER